MDNSSCRIDTQLDAELFISVEFLLERFTLYTVSDAFFEDIFDDGFFVRHGDMIESIIEKQVWLQLFCIFVVYRKILA